MSDLDLEALEIDLLLNGVMRRYGHDFRNYAYPSLRRRIVRSVGLEQVASISALQERILRDPHCMSRFLANLSVNVTSMFRDPEFYLCLRTKVVPMLRTYPFVRIWHAGCSSGEEVYSLAILLHEEGLYERSRIYATDISEGLLQQAAGGILALESMRENTHNYQRSGGDRDFSIYYTAGEKHAIFASHLRRNLVFSNHNLVSDAVFNEFNLILCRNVLIYFDPILRKRVHTLLYDSLGRLGVLGLGNQESLEQTEYQARYTRVCAPQPLFRKQW